MVSTEERAQFKVPAVLREAVQRAAAAEEVAESVVWRRVVKAGVAALGLDLGFQPAEISELRRKLAAPVPVVPVCTTSPPAGWDTAVPDPLDDIA